jgi:hypothetical protein
VKKNLIFLFAFLSVGLILGHSIVPHNHLEDNQDLCINSKKENPSIADILYHMLSRDLGAKHLEEYSLANLQPMTIKSGPTTEFLLFFSFVMAEVKLSIVQHVIFSTQKEPEAQYFFRGKGLRAPPFHT